jgi:hypothetical protein
MSNISKILDGLSVTRVINESDYISGVEDYKEYKKYYIVQDSKTSNWYYFFNYKDKFDRSLALASAVRSGEFSPPKMLPSFKTEQEVKKFLDSQETRKSKEDKLKDGDKISLSFKTDSLGSDPAGRVLFELQFLSNDDYGKILSTKKTSKKITFEYEVNDVRGFLSNLRGNSLLYAYSSIKSVN